MNWGSSLMMFGCAALLFLVAFIAVRLGRVTDKWGDIQWRTHKRNSLNYQIRIGFILALAVFFFVLGFVFLFGGAGGEPADSGLKQ